MQVKFIFIQKVLVHQYSFWKEGKGRDWQFSSLYFNVNWIVNIQLVFFFHKL